MRKLLFILLFLSSTTYGAGVTLQWDPSPTAAAEGVTHYNIERKAAVCGAAGAFAEITTVTASVRTFVDSGLVPGTNYCWRVAASNASGKSPYSNTVGQLVVAPPVIPTPPSNLTITVVIGMNWSPELNTWVVADTKVSTDP